MIVYCGMDVENDCVLCYGCLHCCNGLLKSLDELVVSILQSYG